VEKPPKSELPQAAELSDFEEDPCVLGGRAVLVVAALPEESAVLDEEESEDEVPDSVEGAEVVDAPEVLPESLPELLPERRRESLRESVR